MFMMLMVVRKTVIGNRMTLESICKTKDGGDNFEPGALLPVPPPRHHPLPHNHPPPLPHHHLLLLEDSVQVIQNMINLYFHSVICSACLH